MQLLLAMIRLQSISDVYDQTRLYLALYEASLAELAIKIESIGQVVIARYCTTTRIRLG